MTAEDSKRIRAVFRHFGIPDAEHDARIELGADTQARRRTRMTPIATYKMIYATFTDRELKNASRS